MRRRILSWIIVFALLVPLVASVPVTGAAAEPETGGADSESITADKIQVGDYIELGSYNGKPVKWRCIGYGSPTNPQRYSNVQNDYITDWNYVMYESDAASGEVPLFLADEVLCNKAFDAASAEGNAKQSSHNLRTESAQYGSNLWSDSNIRDWLNSDAPAGEVEWTCGNVPDAEHIAGSQGEENFPYDMEAGFLSNFTDEEQRVMMTVRQKQILGKPDADWTDNTKQYGYDRYNDTKTENISISSFPSDEYGRCYYRLSTDTMFLLDIKQADTLYKNCTADKLGSDYYQGEYFLRSPLVHSAQPDVYVKAFSSSKSSNIECISANSESGIRPAFYACETAKSVSGDGSKDNPYILRVPVTPDETISAKKIKVGDYVEMGTYYGEMIRWRCVGFDKILRYEEDGTPVRKDNGYKGIFSNDTERLEIVDLVQSQEWKEGYLPIMISEHVITFKPYDANCDDDANCEGTSHAYRTNEGKTSNCWSDSNLRSWLNSDAAAGEVEWLCGNPPDRSHVDQGVNAYDGEAGFLSNFTENELGAIKEASRKVVLSLTDKEKADVGTGRYETAQFKFYKEIQGYSDAYGEYVMDKMFCPDAWQIGVYEDYWRTDILNECGKATEQALAHRGFSYQTEPENYYPFWLSTPDFNDGSVYARFYDKSTGRTSITANASTGYTGVCPAFYLNVDAGFVQGDGSESFPYSFREPEERASVKTGEYVKMGTYNGEDILWRCVGEDNFGTLMVSDQILSVKPFDASGTTVIPAGGQGANATSHGRGWQGDTTSRKKYGSNYWSDSNLKSWLNSGADAGEVEWLCGNPPNSAHVLNGVNAYDDEAGFLNGFTRNEISAMHKCDPSAAGGTDWYRSVLPGTEGYELGYNMGISDGVVDYMGTPKPNIEIIDFGYDTYKYEKTYDRVFLLDAKQLKMIYNNRNYLGGKYYMARPTAACIAQSESGAGMKESSYFTYWMRTPSGATDEKMALVQADGSIADECAYNGEVGGVRPAFYIERNLTFAEGDGTKEAPYVIDSPEDKAAYEEAKEAESKIKEIPDKIELTEECEDKIRAAREAYDGLSQKAQALVLDKTLEKLSTAETELANLKAIDGVDKSVEDLVETMGDGITVDNIITVGEKIKAAHKAYDDLAPNLQAKVANYEALTTVETAYEEASTVTSVKIINLDESKKMELTLGTAAASAQLEAEILPATAAVVQKAEWSSSKEGIVSVIGEGVRVTVAAAAAGETEITVRAGQEADSCTVSVKEAPEDTVAVERIDLNQTEVQLDLKENQTVQLEALVYPANASNPSLEWSIDAKDVAIVTAEGNKATVTAAAAGTATVTVQSTAFPSIQKECKITVKADGGSAEDSELTDMEAEKALNDALHAAEDIYEYGSTSEENAAIYTPDTWNRFQEAYEAAKNLKADATPAEKKALADAADDARRALVPDASKLTENTANALANAMVSNTGNFEDVSWNDYEAAFGKLKEAAESGSATEKELAELLVLFHAAEKKLKADDDWLGAKQGLDSVLAAADTYLGKQSQYERAAWEAFMTAYNDAQDLSKATKATATQQAIEETAKALNDAVTKLLASPVKPADSTTQDPVSKNPAAEEPEEPEEPEIEEDDYKDIKGIRYSVTDVDKRTVSAAAVTSSKKKLTKVSIPDTVDIEGVMFFVTEIQSGGFKKCTKITKVTLGRNVQKIGNSAFEGCSKMTSLNVMETEKVSFGKKSFYNCKKLGKIIIKSKNSLFVKKAFSKTKRGASVTLSKKIAKNERNNIKKILKTAGIKNGRYKFK